MIYVQIFMARGTPCHPPAEEPANRVQMSRFFKKSSTKMPDYTFKEKKLSTYTSWKLSKKLPSKISNNINKIQENFILN